MKAWFIVGVITGYATIAVALAFGLHPGATSDPVAAAISMTVLAVLAALFAYRETK